MGIEQAILSLDRYNSVPHVSGLEETVVLLFREIHPARGNLFIETVRDHRVRSRDLLSQSHRYPHSNCILKTKRGLPVREEKFSFDCSVT